jgi:hypothetical protein
MLTTNRVLTSCSTKVSPCAACTQSRLQAIVEAKCELSVVIFISNLLL